MEGSPTEKVERLNKMIEEMVEISFPIVKVKLSNQDLPYITSELKTMARAKKKEYKKNGRSMKYKKLVAVYKKKLKEEAGRYLEKNVSLIKNSNPGRAAKVLRTLGQAPGQVSEKDFTLTRHLDEGFSVDKQREEIMNYFAKVSKEFPPIEVKNLSLELQRKLEQCTVPENVPFLDLWSVKEALRNTNHTMSRAPGDMPPNLRQEFYQWLAELYQAILTEIVRTGEWPRQWKLEYGTPIPKESPPLTDED